MTVTDWNPLLRDQFEEAYWRDLQSFVAAERDRAVVYPPRDQVFAALHETAYADTKCLILGQDPYHGAHQAHGLCFSVKSGVAIPPSLVNIFKELADDLGCATPSSGDLTPWAHQGVLLLNATLTVRARQAGSHQKKGWETFTDRVISVLNDKPERVVFVLWGGYAKRKAALVTNPQHVLIQSPHPSPLSAYHGFFGSKPFSRANAALAEVGIAPIDWCLP